MGSLCRQELGWRHLLGRLGEQGHGAFGEVAAVADLPLVVGLNQHGPGQPEQRLGVGEHPDHVGVALDLLVEPLQGLVDQIFFQWLGGKEVKASSSGAASRSIASSLGN